MKTYYEDKLVRLYHGDCREILPTLDIPNSLVIADPCYGQTSLEWDKWDDAWLTLTAPSVRALWCFGSLRMFMEHAGAFAAGGWKLSQDVVWEKHSGSSFHNDRFRRVHEQACHFYRGEWSTIPHFTPTTNDATKRTVRRKERPPHMGVIAESTYVSHDGGPRLMRSVIYCRSEHGRAWHPTQKPVEIIKPLIHYGSYQDGQIIVPFAGSGSELVAAKQMGRVAIGCELQECHCETAAKRLSQDMLVFQQ